jgi:hypothetical protein
MAGRAEAGPGLFGIDYKAIGTELANTPFILHKYAAPDELHDFVFILDTYELNDGIVTCNGSEGDVTQLAAVLLGDSEFPTRVPFKFDPDEPNVLALTIPTDNTVGFFMSYHNDHEVPGTVRAATVRLVNQATEVDMPLAYAKTPSDHRKELAYAMTNANAHPRSEEQDVARRLGLFDQHGFDIAHTRGIFKSRRESAVEPIPIRPDYVYQVSNYLTLPQNNAPIPLVTSLQGRFLIKVHPLAA